MHLQRLRLLAPILLLLAAPSLYGQNNSYQPAAPASASHQPTQSQFASHPAVAPASSPVQGPFHTQQTSFGIPVNVRSVGQQIIEVQLLVSVDRGENWSIYQRRLPDSGEIPFQTKHDGEYWFALRTIDQNHQPNPARVTAPEMIVSIDRSRPQFSLDIQRGQPGSILMRWDVLDPNLVPESLKIEVQPVVPANTPQPDWQPLQLPSPARGVITRYTSTYTWWPQTEARQVNVRAEVRDKAGNVAQVVRRIGIDRVAHRHVASTAQPPSQSGDPFANRTPPATPTATSGRTIHWPANQQGNLSNHQGTGTQETVRQQTHSTFHPTDDQQQVVGTSQPRPISSPSSGGFGQPHPRDRTDQPRQHATGTPGQLVSTRQTTESRQQPAGRVATRQQSTTAVLPEGEHARLTNSRRFRLSYEVDSVGPAGVAKVELWVTRDGGRQWFLWGEDADRLSPMVAEVDQEGIYGFRIVIASNDGLSGETPQPGDLADLWIEVDLTAPVAKLQSAMYGKQDEAGKLIIQWDAADAKLASRPATLLYSEHVEGPWKMIAAGLPNSGRYAWLVDGSIPKHAYLRLEVIDRAGNLQVDQLANPINLGGIHPRGTVRGFVPIQ